MKRGELYRDKKNGRIAGVCAGVADYFGIETWLVRILTVTAFLLAAGPFVLVAYIAAWFILDEKSTAISSKSQSFTHKGFVNTETNVDASSASYGGKGYKNQTGTATKQVLTDDRA